MSDNFFGFDATLEGGDALDEGLLSEEDEEDYDALNDETFGDSVITGDWEQDHEKLAEITELSRHSLITENGDLSAKIAAFILDDEPKTNNEQIEPSKPKTRPPPGFFTPTNDTYNDKGMLPNFKVNNMCTVEEIERNLIKRNSVRLEDLERRIILQQNTDVLGLRPPNAAGPGFIKPLNPQNHNILKSHLSKTSPVVPFQMAAPTVPNLSFVLPWNCGPWSCLTGTQLVRVPRPLDTNSRVVPPTTLQQTRVPPDDEYAGLMTSKEKNWLASLQYMQISTNQPFQDDYYFTMYHTTHSGNHSRKIGSSIKNAREVTPLVKPTYTPQQFENSLGKLQVGSVMAPRKIIDTDVVENIDCSSVASASKKVKQILLEIEHMFSTVLLAEEVISPLCNHSPNDAIDPSKLFQKTIQALLKDDKLNAVLNIRKGKTLVLRLLPHTEVSTPLIHKLISILPSAAKKDGEQNLLRALPAIRYYLSSCTLKTLVDFSENLKNDIEFLLPNKLGVSVIANMMERAEALISQSPDNDVNDWISFISLLVGTCYSCKLERPVVGIHGPTLAKHLSRCPQSSNEKVATLQKALSNLSTIEKG